MKRPEQFLQEAVVEYLAILENQGKLTYFSVPNEGKRGWVAGKAMKAKGLRKGASDLVLLLPGPNVGLLELKAPGKKIEPEQILFQQRGAKFGCHCFCADNFTDAKASVDALVKCFPQRSAA